MWPGGGVYTGDLKCILHADKTEVLVDEQELQQAVRVLDSHR